MSKAKLPHSYTFQLILEPPSLFVVSSVSPSKMNMQIVINMDIVYLGCGLTLNLIGLGSFCGWSGYNIRNFTSCHSRSLGCVRQSFSTSLTPTKVIILKTQLHAVNACVTRSSQRSLIGMEWNLRSVNKCWRQKTSVAKTRNRRNFR